MATIIDRPNTILLIRPDRTVIFRGTLGGGSGSGVTDHGALSGLSDDDHPQYALADGSRGDFEPTGTAAAAVSAFSATLGSAALADAGDFDAAGTAQGEVLGHNEDPMAHFLGDSATRDVGTGSTQVAAGDHSHAGLTAQSQATWEAGVGTSESVVSPAKVAAAIAALGGGTPGGSNGQLQYNAAGSFGGIAGTSWVSNQLLITAQAAATTPLAVRAAASHCANIQEWQNSAGTVVAQIDASGRAKVKQLIGPGATVGGVDFTSGYTRVIGYDGKASIAVSTSTGVPVGQYGWGFGSNYFTTDALLARVAAAIIGVRGATSSAGAALSFIEQTAPSAPATNGVYIYAEDNGSGKTRLMARFATGAAQQIAIEP